MTSRPRFNTRKIFWLALTLVVLNVFAIIYLLPFLRSIPASVMTWEQARKFPPEWIPNPFTTLNFEKLFMISLFFRWVLNSAIYAGIVIAGNVLFATMAGYAFARMRFPGNDALFSALLALMMIPGFVMLVPNYIIMYRLNLVDNLYGLAFLGLVSTSSVFLMRQYFVTFPRDIFEAARLDGCSHIKTFFYIAFPLAKPAIGAVAVYMFLGAWNAFLGPLIFLRSPENYTLPLGLHYAFARQWYVEYTPIIAGSLLATLPIIVLFVALNKYLIRGIVITGGKG